MGGLVEVRRLLLLILFRANFRARSMNR